MIHSLTLIGCFLKAQPLMNYWLSSSQGKSNNTKFRKLVDDANFPNNETKQRPIWDAIITGIFSDHVKPKAMQKGNDAILEFIVSIVRAKVSSKHHLSLIQETSEASVNHLQYDCNVELFNNHNKCIRVATTPLQVPYQFKGQILLQMWYTATPTWTKEQCIWQNMQRDHFEIVCQPKKRCKGVLKLKTQISSIHFKIVLQG